MSINSGDIDRWLHGLARYPVIRYSVHRCIKVFFSFAKARSYLPASEATAAEVLSLAREGDTVTEIFRPSEIRVLLEAYLVYLLGLYGE
ncbi:MAG: hypothetical protein ACKO8Z_03275 [Prosthecobacter sp.]